MLRNATILAFAAGFILFLTPGELAQAMAGPHGNHAVERALSTPDPLAVSPSMRAWLRTHPLRKAPAPQRLNYLASALIERFQIQRHDQEDHGTLSAAEAFEAGGGNCVSFALLFVALARELGEPATFALSEGVEDQERHGDLQVLNVHLAAAILENGHLTIFDLAGRQKNPARFRPVEDATARAVFLSNRGATHLLEGRTETALTAFDQALALDPALSLAWTNRGVALRRLGKLRSAETAYRRAIDLRPDSVSAWRNLALLLAQRLGNN